MLTTMTLEEIAALLDIPAGRAPRMEISDLAHDSRRTAPGSLFFCVRGARADGHDFAREAVGSGAVALVCERAVGSGVPELLVGNARLAMTRVAAPFFGNPSSSLELVGVTGTNGKTTVCYMLDAINRADGSPGGLIGTVEVRVGEDSFLVTRGTPEAVDLQRLLRGMADQGVTRCAMEVTSIGMAEGRMEGTTLRVAVFTNLTREHLDEYHQTMERYYQAKRALFSPEYAGRGLINADDEWGRRLLTETGIPSVSFGIESGDLQAVDLEVQPRESHFRIQGLGLDFEVKLPVPARFNVENALAAAGAAHIAGAPGERIRRGLCEFRGAPGRLELIDEGQDFTVAVDYAHTPAALSNVLLAAREMGSGRLIAVFGCGGDRDRSKRPLMGEAAAKASDLAVVTSDNPRSEDPLAIIREIEAGMKYSPPALGYRLIPDREEAIAAAIREARAGDVVVIAGKGHEETQEIQGDILPFDDRVVAASILRRANGPSS